MIIFEGQITGACWQEFCRQYKKGMLFYPILSIICWVFVCGIGAGTILHSLLPLTVSAPLFALTFIPLFISYKPGSKISPKHWNRITIDTDEGTLYLNEGKREEEFIMLDDITKIYDFGEFYHIWDLGPIYCQKSLLLEGTIEEFEKIFEGKIIRKY